MSVVRLAKAEKFPSIIAKYAKPNQFRKLAKKDALGSKTYTKGSYNTGNVRVLKVDTKTISGVLPMNGSGKKG